MEGVEEELLEGEMMDEEMVDGSGNREMEKGETGNGKTDREDGRMGEDVEIEGEK